MKDQTLNNEVLEEVERRIACPDEETIERVLTSALADGRDVYGHVLHAHLQKLALEYNDQYPELQRLATVIAPAERLATYSYTEKEARLLAWALVELDCLLQLRISRHLPDDLQLCFWTALENHRQIRPDGAVYLGPEVDGFAADSGWDGGDDDLLEEIDEQR